MCDATHAHRTLCSLRPWSTATLFLTLLAAPSAASAQDSCPLPINDTQLNGYKLRSDRCEGVYRREVASTYGAQIVSLGAASDLEDLCEQQPVRFVWPNTPSAPVRLQVESLRHRLYYRLDAVRPPQQTEFLWPRDPRCSNEVRLKRSEIGVVARTTTSIGAKPIDLLLPVRLASVAVSPVSPPYDLVLLPGRAVSEVFVSLWYYGNVQQPVRILNERPLNQRPYPPGARIDIRLSAQDVKQMGIYRVKASVEFDSGTPETIDVYFLGSR